MARLLEAGQLVLEESELFVYAVDLLLTSFVLSIRDPGFLANLIQFSFCTFDVLSQVLYGANKKNTLKVYAWLTFSMSKELDDVLISSLIGVHIVIGSRLVEFFLHFI